MDYGKVFPYSGCKYLEDPNGFIVWRRGTGDNAELLHLKAYVSRRGTGSELLRRMLVSLREEPPYHTVYGFTRVQNFTARLFYRKMGFELSVVAGVYKDGNACLFSAPYEELWRVHCAKDS